MGAGRIGLTRLQRYGFFFSFKTVNLIFSNKSLLLSLQLLTEKAMNIVERFIKYVKIDTQSDENNSQTPSTQKQFNLAKEVEREMIEMGLTEVSLDNNCYLMATLPSNINKEVPTIGFIAHFDTSPDMSGENVNPRIVKNYDGKDIVLNEEQNIISSPNDFPELLKFVGDDIIVTDGTTLLGADDKAGIAEIMTAMEYLIAHPEIKHGKIRIGFTPDEEIGRGADKFDVEKFGAEWAYTMDGSEIGELEYENFNAAVAKISIQGRNVHPGYAKNKMINALHIANELVQMLPANEKPEHTEKYEGFFHLIALNGGVEDATLTYIIRDHDRNIFENRKKVMEQAVSYLNARYDNRLTLEMRDQYYNMREKVEPVKHVVDYAFQAMEEVGITPIVKPIRGGTDGARLSFMGLPCPNIFAGGMNFHGRYEFIPIKAMEKATQVIVKIAELVAK
ncbi:MAG: Peptidase T [Bacteroidetes bacterium ADurb.BinA174]|nr:MAG: Peptidase T [Bacteroidetes bacterium ADurb.BinA174]